MEKLKSGPAFVAHRITSVGKANEKLKQILAAVKVAESKLTDAKVALNDTVLVGADGAEDEVIVSYKTSLARAFQICASFQAVPDLPENETPDSQATKDALAIKEKGFLAAVDASNVSLGKERGNLHCYFYLANQAKLLRETEIITVVEELNDNFKTDFASVDKLVKAATKIATDVKSYVAQKKKKAEKAESQKKAKQEKQALDQAAAVAKKHAEEIKNGKLSNHAIFAVAAEKWQSVAIREPGSAVKEGDLDLPWMMKSPSSVETWRNTAKMSIKLSEFAGSYKRTPTYKSDKRSQAIVEGGAGKEESEALLSSLVSFATLDVSKVQGASSALQSIWYWGYDPKISAANLPPNAAARLQVLVMGELTVITFALTNVVEVMKETKPLTDITLDAIMAFLLAVNESSPHWAKLKGYFAFLKADDVLFVPAGWVVAERSSSSLLLYGVRKSFLPTSHASKENFQCAVDCLKRSQRDSSKMEAVLACFPEERLSLQCRHS